MLKTLKAEDSLITIMTDFISNLKKKFVKLKKELINTFTAISGIKRKFKLLPHSLPILHDVLGFGFSYGGTKKRLSI